MKMSPYKVKPEKETDRKNRVLHRSMLLRCNILQQPSDSFDWNIEAELTHSKK